MCSTNVVQIKKKILQNLISYHILKVEKIQHISTINLDFWRVVIFKFKNSYSISRTAFLILTYILNCFRDISKIHKSFTKSIDLSSRCSHHLNTLIPQVINRMVYAWQVSQIIWPIGLLELLFGCQSALNHCRWCRCIGYPFLWTPCICFLYPLELNQAARKTVSILHPCHHQ